MAAAVAVAAAVLLACCCLHNVSLFRPVGWCMPK